MKKSAFTIAIAILFSSGLAVAQVNDSSGFGVGSANGMVSCPDFYITTGTGMNSNTGPLGGLDVELPYGKKGAFDAGLGWTTWGLKLYAGCKTYLKPCLRGWALGSGLTFSTGRGYVNEYMEGATGYDENVILREFPQLNLLLSVYHYGNLGHKKNRFYLQFGWSFRLAGNLYRQVSGALPINRQAGEYLWDIQLASPGGPVVAIGFSFGRHITKKKLRS